MRHEQDLRNIEHESSRRNIYFKLIMENDGNRGNGVLPRNRLLLLLLLVVVVRGTGVCPIVFTSQSQSVIQFSLAAKTRITGGKNSPTTMYYNAIFRLNDK